MTNSQPWANPKGRDGGDAYHDTIKKMDAFLKSLGYLD